MSGYTGLTVSPFFSEGNRPIGVDDDIEMNHNFGYNEVVHDNTHYPVPDTRSPSSSPSLDLTSSSVQSSLAMTTMSSQCILMSLTMSTQRGMA
jgi:hypothetical protein